MGVRMFVKLTLNVPLTPCRGLRVVEFLVDKNKYAWGFLYIPGKLTSFCVKHVLGPARREAYPLTYNCPFTPPPPCNRLQPAQETCDLLSARFKGHAEAGAIVLKHMEIKMVHAAYIYMYTHYTYICVCVYM